jgi:hypothetical protein
LLGNRKELESNLIEAIKTIKRKKRVINDIKEEVLKDLDLRELYLINEQVFMKTGDMSINPEDYFTEVEVKESRKYSADVKRDKMDYPITLSNATVVGNAAFTVPVSVQVINDLLSNNLLTYDYELQREAKFKRSRDNAIRIEPTLNKKNVDEIEEHLLQGTLVPTTLVFNAMTRSADSGDELTYDASSRELTINSGTDMAIVDGFHRTKAVIKALQKQPDLQFNFSVLITNYSKKQAQQYQAQLAKATPISKVRVQELEANRHSDSVVRQLREESDLKGLISQTNRVHSVNKELVSYNVLADTIDNEFKMSNKAEAMDVGDFLVDFFNVLLGSYSDEFLDNPVETRKESLINDNNIFVGYIVLARKMFEADIKPKQIRNIVKNIDFNKNNKLWQDIGVLDSKLRIDDTNKARKNIVHYFNNIDLGELVK